MFEDDFNDWDDLIDDDIDEPEDEDFGPSKEVELTVEQYTGIDINRFGCFTKEALKFILDNFSLLWYLEDYELDFVARMNKLDKPNRDKIIKMMESIPESLDMVRTNGYGGVCNIGLLKNVPTIICGVGSHKWEYVICDKNKAYREFLQKKLDVLDRIYNDFNPETGEYMIELDDDTSEKLGNMCVEYTGMLEDYGDDWDYQPDEYGLMDDYVEGFSARVARFHKQLFETIGTALSYDEEDWYLLYLLTRVQIADFADNDSKDTFRVNGDYQVKAKESLIWTYLNMLS